MQATAEQFVADLQSGRALKIKIFNLGENMGMDIAFFDHYFVIKRDFPAVTLHLYRSNVDETNCIGLGNWRGRVQLPVDDLVEAVVRQRYPNGDDWTQKLNKGEQIFDPQFTSVDGYDYVWCIGMASVAAFKANYPADTKFIESSVVAAALRSIVRDPATPAVDLPDGLTAKLRVFSRTVMEYACIDAQQYPFTFAPTFAIGHELAQKYCDFMYVGLRLPDHVRWYYTIDRQYEVLFEVLRRVRAAGKPVRVVYTLKDGEIDNNFNRGQSLEMLRRVQDMCDESLFVYTWTANPYAGRAAESVELSKLAQAGIRNVRRVDFWENMLLASRCKVFFTEPAGLAEIICAVRKDRDSTIFFPVCTGNTGAYAVIDPSHRVVALKVNRLVLDQAYACDAVMSGPDNPPIRTLRWFLTYNGDRRQIGENCYHDDYLYFEAAQATVFKDWFEQTRGPLADAVVEQYLK